MNTVTNTAQLSTFSIIRSIILSNSVLAKKFNVKNVLEFEPKPKSSNFSGFPYIVVNVPDVEDNESYIGDTLRYKNFDVEIVLRMDYEARDNYTEYASNLITVIDAANSTFNASGYGLIRITSDGRPQSITVHSKEIIEGTFTLELDGEVLV